VNGSLRRRLLITILVVVGPVVATLAGMLYFAVQRSIWARFDAELVELGETVGELVEYDHEDGYELELGPHPRPLTRGSGHVTYFQLWDPEGEVLSRTEGLSEPLPQPSAALADAELADGRRVRVAVRRFVPHVDDEAPTGLEPPGEVTLVIARETAATQAMLARLATWFVGLGFVTLGLASFAAWWAVRRGLEPLARVTSEIEAIDDRGLSSRLDERALPSELRPMIARTNALLDRLEHAFARERRFTADVAHELRTPLCVLRTELELSLRRERSPAEYRASQAAALETTTQLATMVDNLLLLARLDNAAAPLELARFELRRLVDECWSPHAERARERGLGYTCTIEPGHELESDREKLRIVIANLLANAVEYTEAGGWIRVERDPTAGVLLAVVDSGPPIPQADRERVFDRFWRGDEARADAGVHCGIGLSLARSLCERLGYRLRVEVRASQTAFVLESYSEGQGIAS
jgi:two-component system heavy metal sensor histidine kinase CusS